MAFNSKDTRSESQKTFEVLCRYADSDFAKSDDNTLDHIIDRVWRENPNTLFFEQKGTNEVVPHTLTTLKRTATHLCRKTKTEMKFDCRTVFKRGTSIFPAEFLKKIGYKRSEDIVDANANNRCRQSPSLSPARTVDAEEVRANPSPHGVAFISSIVSTCSRSSSGIKRLVDGVRC